MEHRRRPSLETIRDDRPGRLESEDELACLTWVGRVVFPALAVRIVERRAIGTRLFEDVAEPVRTDPSGVGGDGPYRPKMGRGPQLELLRREFSDPLHQALLGKTPTIVEGCNALGCGGHASLTLTSTSDMSVFASLIAWPSMSLLK